MDRREYQPKIADSPRKSFIDDGHSSAPRRPVRAEIDDHDPDGNEKPGERFDSEEEEDFVSPFEAFTSHFEFEDN